MTGAGELAMFLALGFAALGLTFGPIGAALGRRIGGGPTAGDSHAEIEELRAHAMAEVDDLRTRLAEVEERLDFAERLLAHGEAANQLPGGPRQ